MENKNLTKKYLLESGWKSIKLAPAWKDILDLQITEEELEEAFIKKFNKEEYLLDISWKDNKVFIGIGYRYAGNQEKNYSGLCNDVKSFETLLRLILSGSTTKHLSDGKGDG